MKTVKHVNFGQSFEKPVRAKQQADAKGSLLFGVGGFQCELTIMVLLCSCLTGWAQAPGATEKPKDATTIYVPYKDIAAILSPAGKTVLMDRAEFAKLLAAANANTAGADAVELGEVVSAQYTAAVKAGNVDVAGEMIVVSMSDKPVAVPMAFAQIGLTKFLLDDQPAPLGYDSQGRLCLVVSGKGKHRLLLEGSTTLRELAKGGMQFGLSVPAAVAGAMKLTAPGDLEIHASVPVAAPVYDKASDKTTAELTLGGQTDLSVTLLGNGRAEDQRAILLGESAEAVQLTGASQTLTCQYTVQVLRRGVRELQFTLPAEWTISDVTCPNMVKWSIEPTEPKTKPQSGNQTLTVRLRTASRGLQQVSIKATAKFAGLAWRSPAVNLVGADYQRGYMLVDTGDDLKVKGESLTFARRENTDTTVGDRSNSQNSVLAVYQQFIAGTLVTAGSRLYYHWGQDWKINLDLAALESRVSSDERQSVRISADDVTLEGRFQVTAVGKELFEVTVELPGASRDAGVSPARVADILSASGASSSSSAASSSSSVPQKQQQDAGGTPATHEAGTASPHADKMSASHEGGTPSSQQQGWNLESVLVNGQAKGFEYRVVESGAKRLLKIELAAPIPAEGVAEVAVLLRHSGAKPLELGGGTSDAAVPLMRLQSNTTVGQVSVQTVGDLDVSTVAAPPSLKEIPVGRMASLGLGGDVQLAWSYHALGEPSEAASRLDLRLSRRMPRISADSVGLLTVLPGKLIGDWRVAYYISRATTRTLYLLADKSLGQNLTIEPYVFASDNQQRAAPRSVRLTSKAVVSFSGKTVSVESVSKELTDRYNLWQLTLDGDTAGLVAINVRYEIPPPEGSAQKGFDAPLVRPFGKDQFTIKDEMLAIQAGEELAVSQQSTGASEVDAIDLPPLPASAQRLLWALRLESPMTASGAVAGVKLQTTIHGNYATPPALVVSASYTTFVDRPSAGAAPCRTEATFDIVNSGMQFLNIRLPKDAELWSIRVGDEQAKPKRGEGNLYLVSLPRCTTPLPVKVVYASRAAGGAGGLALAAATLEGVRVNQVRWTVIPPPGYQVQSPGGQMRTAGVGQSVPAYEQVIGCLGGFGSMPGGMSARRHQAKVNELDEAARSNQFDASREPSAETPGEIISDNAQATAKSRSGNEPSEESESLRPSDLPQIPPATQPSARPQSNVSSTIAENLRARLYIDSVSMTGRYTLPVDLVATPGAGPAASFTALGSPNLPAGGAGLEISLVSQARTETWWGVGFALVALLGVWKARSVGAGGKAAFIIAVLAISSLAAIWSSAGAGGPWVGVVALANGAFYAALNLVWLYLLIGLVRCWCKRWASKATPPSVPPVAAGGASSAPSVASVIVAILVLAGACGAAFAGTPDEPGNANPAADQDHGQDARGTPGHGQDAHATPEPLVVPYDDPTKATESSKILVPYAQFVRLWNLAHPEMPLELPLPVAGAAMADVKYSVTLVKGDEAGGEAKGKLEILLQMQVIAPWPGHFSGPGEEPRGKRKIVIPMPLTGMAVSSATFNGKPAALQVGPGGMVLAISPESLGGKASGELKVSAVATPKFATDSARSARVDLGLPSLPGAVMTVSGLADDLVLEAYLGGNATPWTLGKTTTAAGTQWKIPLGEARDVSLRWNPQAAAGAADRTLSAAAAHDVYAFHWAILGVSRISYTFSAGQNDRFAFLLPDGAEIRNVTGPNIRDHRVVGDKDVDGEKFKVVEVRLYRGASKSYELTVDWLGKLPAMDKPEKLSLPRAADVGRESGTVTLHAAGGMSLKVTDVVGGRRSGEETSLFSGQSGAEAASRVGQYYWPYRPFAITVELSRAAAASSVRMDQLVRIAPEREQLFVDATWTAQRGKLFEASFALPDGYELLSAVGPAVADWYVQTTPAGRRAHVSLRSGVDWARIALALLREGAPFSSSMGVSPMSPTGVPPVSGASSSLSSSPSSPSSSSVSSLNEQQQQQQQPDHGQDARATHGQDGHATPEDFTVPTVMAIDADGSPMKDQSGRLAIQVAASLEAQTAGSENLKPTAPSAVRDWLGPAQTQAVQFAYTYEKPKVSLSLKVRPLPTKVRVELLAALGVRPTAANYSYRLRYTITGSPIDRVSFTMPTEYAPLVAVSCPSLRNVATSVDRGNTKWTVTLVNEVTGLLDVSVNFALPIDSSTTHLLVPRIVTEAPAGYEAVVAVQNLSRHELSIKDKDKDIAVLAPMPAARQQLFLRQEMLGSLQFVWESFTDNWSLDLTLSPAKTASRISKVVDLLALTTVIDRDGHMRYEARIALQNRSEQFLRVRLPKDLELWSAIVAGQPVKPVLDSAGPADEVLIPLVKTSAGGLPYDVRLYLAGKTAAPLGSLTKIQPPPIELVGIDVQRTTWSLRLPAGYRYTTSGAGGNMSPIAGTAERMAIETDATLEQFKRFSDVSDRSADAAKSSFYRSNWNALNDKITRQREQTKTYIDNNKDKLSGEDYSKLNAKLADQTNSQQGVQAVWKAAQRNNANLSGNANVNGFVAETTTNAGLEESKRDWALNDLPTFFDEANKGNIAAVKSEMQLYQTHRPEKSAEPQGNFVRSSQGVNASDLLSDREKNLEMGVTGKTTKSSGGKDGDLNEPIDDTPQFEETKEGDKVIQKAQETERRLAEKESQLADNRAYRTLKGNNNTFSGSTISGTATHGTEHTITGYSQHDSGVQSATTPEDTARTISGWGGGGQAGGGWAQFGPGSGGARSQSGPGSALNHADPFTGQQTPEGTLSISGGVTIGSGGLETPYVGGGTFSLPVQLPAGDVQLDFSHPAGGASVAVWAVSLPMLHAAYATAGLVVCLIVLLLGGKLFKRSARWNVPRLHLAIYLAVIVVLTLIAGLWGLAAAMVIDSIIEGLRRRPIRSSA
jgi:hypothetical protein